MRKSLGCISITKEAWFILLIFEVIMLYRIYIIAFQDELKENASTKQAWSNVMITYFSCCEIILYLFLLGVIVH